MFVNTLKEFLESGTEVKKTLAQTISRAFLKPKETIPDGIKILDMMTKDPEDFNKALENIDTEKANQIALKINDTLYQLINKPKTREIAKEYKEIIEQVEKTIEVKPELELTKNFINDIKNGSSAKEYPTDVLSLI